MASKGDIVCYQAVDGRRFHVGIYVGDDKIIHLWQTHVHEDSIRFLILFGNRHGDWHVTPVNITIQIDRMMMHHYGVAAWDADTIVQRASTRVGMKWPKQSALNEQQLVTWARYGVCCVAEWHGTTAIWQRKTRELVAPASQVDECCVCLEEMNEWQTFSCRHAVCCECFRCLQLHEIRECPYCRHPIDVME